jgi:hypothetical protein
MPRPRRPNPSGEEIAERILVALRTAGGTIHRSRLREALGRTVNDELLEVATELLVKARMVTVAFAKTRHITPQGVPYIAEAIVYRLVVTGRKWKGS